MTEKITINAPAKINLWLDIVDRRPDGYHNIESVMQSVSLYDTLTFEKAGAIELTCSEPSLDCGESNLCYRAAKLFFGELGLQGGARIHVEKRIPIAAGLAGGSTDAAATLIGLDKLYGVGLSTDRLCELGARLGADVPFCVRKGICVTKGVGDILSPCPRLPKCYIIIAKTGEGVSTPLAYRTLDEMYDFTSRVVDVGSFTAVLETGDINLIAKSMTNIFESAILPIRKDTQRLKEYMLECGALHSMMSGSGPSVFGVFDSPCNAEKAKQALLDKGIDAHLCEPIY